MNLLNWMFLALFVAMPNLASAMRYQIKFLNTPEIVVGGKALKVNDWFDDRSIIKWSNPKQAIKVVSEDKKVYTLSATSYSKLRPKTFKDYVIFVKPLATRGGVNGDLLSELKQVFDNEYVMLDSIAIDLTSCSLPRESYFVFTGEDEKGHSIEFRTSHNGVELFIRRNELEDGSDLSGQVITLRVDLFHANGDNSLITKYFEIEICPLWII